MEAGCNKTYLWELDQDFQTSGRKSADAENTKAILRSMGILEKERPEVIENVGPEETSDSDSELSATQYDVRLGPECEYTCQKDIGWFDLVRSPTPWDDARKPYTRISKYEDLNLTDKEKQGVLSGMVVSTGIRHFDNIPMTDGIALTKLELPDRGLIDIQILDVYKYLQYLDLSHNAIKDLSPVESMMYLIVLDASHNTISAYSPNPPPWFLTYLNLSHNEFEHVPNVTSLWSLKHLNFSNNRIKQIEDIQNLSYLEYLNLSYNEISIIENIGNVPLKSLDLSWNCITECVDNNENCASLNTITTLERLDLSHNNIQSMANVNLINPSCLRHLNIAYNKFNSMASFDDLKRYKALCYLRFEGNEIIHEISEIPSYIMYMMPQLKYINGNKLRQSERASAYSMWSSDPVIRAMKKYCQDLIYNNVSPPEIGNEVLTHLNYNLPIVVLVGAAGTRKNCLASAIAEKYPQFVKLPTLHTTMFDFSRDECESKEFEITYYYHLSNNEFHRMRNDGKFVFVDSDLGDLFGLSRDELENDGRICLLALPIGPALSLTWQGFDTKMILIQPGDEEDYSDLLQRYVATKMKIHKERDTLEEIIRIEEDENQEIAANEKNGQRTISTELSGRLSALQLNSLEGISNKQIGNEKMPIKSGSNSSNRSSGSLKSDGSSSSQKSKSIKSISKRITTSIDNEFPECQMSEEFIPAWCDDQSDEVEVEVVCDEKSIKLPYIETMNCSQEYKGKLWTLFRMYYNEKTTYENIKGQHFTQTVKVEDIDVAMKKIQPIIADKYNSNLKKPSTIFKEKDPLYYELVEPRLNEMLETLSNTGSPLSFFRELEPVRDASEISSSEPSKSTLSVPFFSASTSSLDVTPSTSLTEIGSQEKLLEDPSYFKTPQKCELSSPASSEIIETKAKRAMENAGFDLTRVQENLIYYKKNQLN